MATNRLKYLRKDANLSLKRLSEYVNISDTVLSYLETERRPFRQMHIDILCAFFNVTTDYLLGKSDYGLQVFPQFGDEIMVTESEYLRLTGNINVEVIHQDFDTNIVDLGNNVTIVLPQHSVYRELKGEARDYDIGTSLIAKMNELAKHMTNDELQKTINFIEDYILK